MFSTGLYDGISNFQMTDQLFVTLHVFNFYLASTSMFLSFFFLGSLFICDLFFHFYNFLPAC